MIPRGSDREGNRWVLRFLRPRHLHSYFSLTPFLSALYAYLQPPRSHLYSCLSRSHLYSCLSGLSLSPIRCSSPGPLSFMIGQAVVGEVTETQNAAATMMFVIRINASLSLQGTAGSWLWFLLRAERLQ